MLESPISEEEVWNIIKQLQANKAPNLDDFTRRFYMTCWQVIKGDFMSATSTIWRMNFKKIRLLNKAFITLILKKGDAIHAEDFMPVSLIYSFVKLKMKIVANKLNARLDSLVPKNQSDFIKGRFIQGNFMLVQQIAKYLHTQKQPRSLLRLDITKVFDSVSWTFLMEMLEKLGFGRIWRDVMSGMLTTSSTQVLLNGVPAQSITHW
jgi:hypothetical protein